uniref:Ig-like domain-containing protein n=1 Tax=Oreochromis niloticus TaxID=8128 RepID=I3KVM7_ORENI
ISFTFFLSGVHTFQRMSGCEWDDETGEVNGFNQFGYDGEDFIAFDLKTRTWIPTKPQAVIFKLQWDNNREALNRERNNVIIICPEMLKKFLNHGRTFLVKPAFPSVSLLQKTPSSPVTCHATGFNPDKVNMVWRKDGVEIHEDVNRGEILPNNDWTFQMSVDLEMSSVRPEDWERYACVFQFSGVNQDIVTKLDKANSRQVSHRQFIIIIVYYNYLLTYLALYCHWTYTMKFWVLHPTTVQEI